MHVPLFNCTLLGSNDRECGEYSDRGPRGMVHGALRGCKGVCFVLSSVHVSSQVVKTAMVNSRAVTWQAQAPVTKLHTVSLSRHIAKLRLVGGSRLGVQRD